jgi:hypothetical protein
VFHLFLSQKFSPDTLALKEFAKDGDVDSLLETLRLVARAQGGIAAWLGSPRSAVRL